MTSADTLNQKLTEQLKAKGINLQDIKLNNQEWDESTTTLSGLGEIIVQVAVTVATGGAGTGFVNAAIASVQNQILSAMAESIITGNSLNLNPKDILKTALTAGATQYAMSELGVNDFVEDNTKNPLTDQMNIKDYAQNTAIKGTVQGVKTEILGGEFKNGFEAGATTSIISDGALQMRQYVKDNFDYAGKNGEIVPENVKSAGVRMDDEVKLAGSHLNSKDKNIKAPLGGSQLGERLFFGIPYGENSIVGKGLELGAGPHDAMSSWNYQNIGDKTYLKNDNFLINVTSVGLLIPTVPFAVAPAVEDNLDFI